MISFLFLIPAVLVGYAICYFVMTYRVSQD